MAEPNWANRTMWTGDNLDIMRGMNSESVDLIYLDPPFNSNRDYAAPIGSKAAGAAFKDTWTLNDVDVAWHGYLADKEPGLYAAIDAARHTHGKSMQSYLIMMGIRLVEMRRILKPTGSIYLHCDPTAGHYLKMVMDAVFGTENFRNEIVWKRSSGHPLSIKKFDVITDTILTYQKSKKFVFRPILVPYSQEMVDRDYRYTDEHGRYASDNLTGGKAGGESAYLPFHGVYPPKGRGWAPPSPDKLPKWATNKLPLNYENLNQLEKCEVLDTIGLIHWSASGKPRFKRYLPDKPTRNVTSLWDDVAPLSAKSKERLGYPTQKPLTLLERIIKASTSEEEIVLDPFCGCATACVAAERLNRQWVGIDLSSLAVRLVKNRIRNEIGIFSYAITERNTNPKRTDQGKIPNYRTHRHTLYGQQEGLCNGCGVHFPFQNLTMDHIIPRVRGGTDHVENLQMLCSYCNSVKGDRDMPYLLAELERLKMLAVTPPASHR